MHAYKMFGIHAANMGGVPALIANVALIVCNKMYVNDNASPIPRYNPIPPLRFLDDSYTPIMVRINEAKLDAIRLWYSTSYCTTFDEPRCCCLDI